MAKTASPIPVTRNALLRLFGIQREHLKAAGVEPYSGTSYDLNQVLLGCDHIAAKFLALGADETGAPRKSAQALKTEKTEQEVRKLTIENDLREGRLVKVDDVVKTYSRNIKAMTDRLDAIPSRVKVACPDISQSVLDEIRNVLTAARNAAVMDTDEDSVDNL